MDYHAAKFYAKRKLQKIKEDLKFVKDTFIDGMAHSGEVVPTIISTPFLVSWAVSDCLEAIGPLTTVATQKVYKQLDKVIDAITPEINDSKSRVKTSGSTSNIIASLGSIDSSQLNKTVKLEASQRETVKSNQTAVVFSNVPDDSTSTQRIRARYS